MMIVKKEGGDNNNNRLIIMILLYYVLFIIIFFIIYTPAADGYGGPDEIVPKEWKREDSKHLDHDRQTYNFILINYHGSRSISAK